MLESGGDSEGLEERDDRITRGARGSSGIGVQEWFGVLVLGRNVYGVVERTSWERAS
jgi:hypothetical protein